MKGDISVDIPTFTAGTEKYHTKNPLHTARSLTRIANFVSLKAPQLVHIPTMKMEPACLSETPRKFLREFNVSSQKTVPSSHTKMLS
jgi:hypothetical protein